jgi:ATP-dependent Zn protease|uniref:Uncharacterized protein n=1 Tax=viral metagenome TaxID=1070528 RepID=A0A6C0IV48_9ZZZZ
MYNQKEYFSVTNKDFNIGDSSQAEDDEIDHREETTDISDEDQSLIKEVKEEVLIKKILKPIKKKRVLTRKDFDNIQSVDEVNANKKLESQIHDEKNKNTSKSITIILYGISFALLVGLFLYFYNKKKVNTQMLHS